MTGLARDLHDRVGPYLLLRAIGAGGSARIDLARIDRPYNFQRHVVVKRPLEHLRGDAKVRASLRREARIGGMLRHPNLVAVLDAGIHDDYDYLVLEYVHGTSLRALMEPEGATAGTVRALPLPVALGIAVDVARGLHEAHELLDERGAPLGLVHRDVSPANVLLGLDGTVKLADFGIAKETRVATLSGSMHGTVTYMAPEQCRGHAFDRRADIFSIGVILYELVTRTRLFWADNDVASLHKVLSGQVTPPRRLEATISPALERIVMTAIAHDTADRFATACELADALEALAAVEGLVVGARWLARELEEAVGPRREPWIAATTLVDLSSAGVEPPRPAAEPSLVAVIESIAAERDDAEPIYPTFGPDDERSREEGSIPSAPVLATRAEPHPRRALAMIAGAVAVGIAIGLVVATHTREPASSATSVSPAAPPAATAEDRQGSAPAGPVSAPVPATSAPVPAAGFGSVSDPGAEAAGSGSGVGSASDLGFAAGAVTSPGPHRRPRKWGHLASAPDAGADKGSAVAAPPPRDAAGSGAPRPANVEWRPTMLLPTDPRSDDKKVP